MCHVNGNESNFVNYAAHPWVSHGNNQIQQIKPTLRISPFKRVAKSARVNLNKYWGMLNSKKSVSPVKTESCNDYSEEEMQNRMNELLEAQANAEEQNSINTQIEEESSPRPPTTFFVRQRKLSLHSMTSSMYSSVSSHNFSQSDMEMDCEDSCSLNSVFL